MKHLVHPLGDIYVPGPHDPLDQLWDLSRRNWRTFSRIAASGGVGHFGVQIAKHVDVLRAPVEHFLDPVHVYQCIICLGIHGLTLIKITLIRK